jgi:hypothetical protein
LNLSTVLFNWNPRGTSLFPTSLELFQGTFSSSSTFLGDSIGSLESVPVPHPCLPDCIPFGEKFSISFSNLLDASLGDTLIDKFELKPLFWYFDDSVSGVLMAEEDPGPCLESLYDRGEFKKGLGPGLVGGLLEGSWVRVPEGWVGWRVGCCSKLCEVEYLSPYPSLVSYGCEGWEVFSNFLEVLEGLRTSFFDTG